jgi:hypothetical protein
MFFCSFVKIIVSQKFVLFTSAKVRAVCVKQKSPLVVPNTSRPLRENKNMFFCQQSSAKNREFLVTSNLAPKNQNLTHPLCQYFSQIQEASVKNI